MYAGGNPERWSGHAGKWRNLGATHIAIRTDSAGLKTVDEHLRAIEEYKQAIA